MSWSNPPAFSFGSIIIDNYRLVVVLDLNNKVCIQQTDSRLEFPVADGHRKKMTVENANLEDPSDFDFLFCFASQSCNQQSGRATQHNLTGFSLLAFNLKASNFAIQNFKI